MSYGHFQITEEQREAYRQDNNYNSADDLLAKHKIMLQAWVHHARPDKQLDMVIEEMAELIQAISKLKRCTSLHNFETKGLNSFILRPTDENSDAFKIWENLFEELADVRIMIVQLEYILGVGPSLPTRNGKDSIYMDLLKQKLNKIKAKLT